MSETSETDPISPQRMIFANKKKRAKRDVVFYTNFEEVLQKVGPFGPFQYFCFAVILYSTIEWAVEAPLNDSTCDYIKANCVHWEADKTNLEFFSLVAQFKLVCDDSYNVRWIEIILAASSLVGSILGGHLGDTYGRQTILILAQLLIMLTSMMSTASQSWLAYAIIMGSNCFLYGVIEVTTLTFMMEITSNRYRTIMINAFQLPIAYMSIALIAFLTKNWQSYFIFLNLVASPLAVAFMLFLESPRWLIARNNLSAACDVLNDIAHQRWNNTKARFRTNDISSIHKQEKQGFYWFYHLFSTKRLAKQSLIQIFSVFTYAIVSNTYLYIGNSVHDSAIIFTLLDGVFRLFVPVGIVLLDFYIPKFGRKAQFLLSLLFEGILIGVIIVLIITGTCKNGDLVISILIIAVTMINDCVFWINIVAITTQRYPTVIRCIAIGSLHSIKHLGSIVGIVVLKPLLDSSWPSGAFVLPEALIVATFFIGLFFQPETKGKVLMDQMVQANYGRLENELPRALMRLAAGHKVAQIEARMKYRREVEEVAAAERAGIQVKSPWAFKGNTNEGFVDESEEAPDVLQSTHNP